MKNTLSICCLILASIITSELCFAQNDDNDAIKQDDSFAEKPSDAQILQPGEMHTKTAENNESQEQQQANENDLEPDAASRVERAVMPFTHWIEEKIQNSSFVTPSPYTRKKEEPSNSEGLSLRQAIEIARESFGGTILSADKIEDEGNIVYGIKILSTEGVVKVVKVDSKQVAKDDQTGTANQNK